jgi:hypothetical protein
VARNNRTDIEQYFMSVNAQKYIDLFEALARNGSTPFVEVEPILPVQPPSDLD